MSLAQAAWDRLLGKALRQVPSDKDVYLSFDDGPDASLTPKVLEILSQHNAKATFFVIGKKIANNTELIQRMLREGHSIGNHSIDHSYSIFFKGYKAMSQWILESETQLAKYQIPSVGFRPPVGIRTPELIQVLAEQQLPLILWKQRSFDRALPFTELRAKKMALNTQAGDILLLHDVQKAQWENEFLSSLEVLILDLKAKGYRLCALQKS